MGLAKYQKGEYSELLFATIAVHNGFRVSIPTGYNTPYDLILEKQGKLFRIQVKSRFSKDKDRENCYRVNLCKRDYVRGKHVYKNYNKNEVDFFAVFFKSLEGFYIIPVEDIKTKTTRIYPSKSKCPYGQYFENWEIQ